MRYLLGIIGSFALTGCVTTGADQRLTQQTGFFNRSGVQACLAGGGAATLANVIRASTDGKEGGPSTKSTIISATAGCAVGVGANYYLQAKREQHADEQSRVTAELNDVRADNQRLTSLISTTKEVIAEDKAEIAAVKAKIEAAELTEEQAIAELKTVDSNRAELTKVLANLETRKGEWQKVAMAEKGAGADTSALDAEIATMENHIVALQSEVDDLNEYRKIAPVA